MNNEFSEITVEDEKTISLTNIMIGWYLSNVTYVNAGIFYAKCGIQKAMRRIKVNS